MSGVDSAFTDVQEPVSDTEPIHSMMLEKGPEFIKGYYHAIATFLAMGGVGTLDQEHRDLFEWAPDPRMADPADQVVFRRHGLMK